MNKRVKILYGPHQDEVGTVTQVFTSTGRLLVQLDDRKHPVAIGATAVVVLDED